MMVNIDQTNIHIVPLGSARTWAEKGSKHVFVHGMEEKRQITCSLSSIVVENLLPIQLIFIGSTNRCLPPKNEGWQRVEVGGWHLTCSSNHWSIIDTCKASVENRVVWTLARPPKIPNRPSRPPDINQMGVD
jgi:hypothetical protein